MAACHRSEVNNPMIRLAGIDFGAKLAGTTAITWSTHDAIHTKLCPKGTDADRWLEEQIGAIDLAFVCIDAPLSLPGAYFGQGADYSYREADRQLQAMSPMFLGGLTARAIQFAARASTQKLNVLEVYPAALIRHIPDLQTSYHKKNRDSIQSFLPQLQKFIPFEMYAKPTTYHEIDSMLCWLSGYRHFQGQAIPYGNPKEGIIWI